MHDCVDETGIMMVWAKNEGKRGSREVSTFKNKFLTSVSQGLNILCYGLMDVMARTRIEQ